MPNAAPICHAGQAVSEASLSSEPTPVSGGPIVIPNALVGTGSPLGGSVAVGAICVEVGISVGIAVGVSVEVGVGVGVGGQTTRTSGSRMVASVSKLSTEKTCSPSGSLAIALS